MLDVAGHNVNQRADRDLYIICCPDSRPSSVFEILEEDHVRPAEQRELLEDVRKASFVRVSIFDVAVLLESFDRRFIPARNTKQPVRKHSLAIDQVSQELLDTPLAIGISKFTFLFRQAGEDILQMCRLRPQRADDIAVSDQGDVSFVIRIVFRLFGSVHILDFIRRRRICMVGPNAF